MRELKKAKEKERSNKKHIKNMSYDYINKEKEKLQRKMEKLNKFEKRKKKMDKSNRLKKENEKVRSLKPGSSL